MRPPTRSPGFPRAHSSGSSVTRPSGTSLLRRLPVCASRARPHPEAAARGHLDSSVWEETRALKEMTPLPPPTLGASHGAGTVTERDSSESAPPGALPGSVRQTRGPGTPARSPHDTWHGMQTETTGQETVTDTEKRHFSDRRTDMATPGSRASVHTVRGWVDLGPGSTCRLRGLQADPTAPSQVTSS